MAEEVEVLEESLFSLELLLLQAHILWKSEMGELV
jgi:hypothetical protein